jgi:pseudaminic acid synthase
MSTPPRVVEIAGRAIGPGQPVYVVAEISANHNHDYARALELVHQAKECGADAVKLQTYTPDTMTIDADGPHFRLPASNTWGGLTLHQLYQQAYTPWEWQPRLKEEADRIGITLFSTPFDATAVDFLEEMGVPAHKVASFELMDTPLLRRVARTGKPVVLSTGMARLADIDEAVRTMRAEGNEQLILLRCSSAYPAPASTLNLRTIPHLAGAFGVPVGFSDHSMGIAAAVASVALGACFIEKHFILSRSHGGPDAAFSMEPAELRALVDGVRVAEQALGTVNYAPTEAESGNTVFQRSLFFVEDVRAGEELTPVNVRSIRPGAGLAPCYYDAVIGRRAARDVQRGTPVSWDLVG